MRELNRRANTEFQSEMIEQFIQAVGRFPNGALVELSDGTVGIVIEQNPVRRLRPKLVRILHADKSALPEPSMLDLRDCPAEPDDPEGWGSSRGLEAGAYGIASGDYFL